MELRRLTLLIALGLILQATGCASITSGRKASVTIQSNVPNAHVVIQNKKGETVATVNAPAVVQLDRGYKYFWPARYTATVEAPGYQAEQFEIKSKVNPWTYGNIVLGGPIGLAVDDATGAMWKPAQESYVQNLKPMEAVAAFPAIPG